MSSAETCTRRDVQEHLHGTGYNQRTRAYSNQELAPSRLKYVEFPDQQYDADSGTTFLTNAQPAPRERRDGTAHRSRMLSNFHVQFDQMQTNVNAASSNGTPYKPCDPISSRTKKPSETIISRERLPSPTGNLITRRFSCNSRGFAVVVSADPSPPTLASSR
ncbi:hypothetical protein BDP55DRAFT_636212 [Colletotrichum godetiae]|uniref:Uncharacterized protein n=1 Tax=Colletotrichum godetiae TaxID=1209918 RepID=A0AAJ0ABQ5_9PEZI|nr:uncharacterized protein BDP55DRAFT_636212 [Colletotrichum godetiae]KAK1670991.1 hypothetical protein BDP55DRAFT_636212 [Colletotrichum godetiae]